MLEGGGQQTYRTEESLSCGGNCKDGRVWQSPYEVDLPANAIIPASLVQGSCNPQLTRLAIRNGNRGTGWLFPW